jgi:ankyrin repeat protein
MAYPGSQFPELLEFTGNAALRDSHCLRMFCLAGNVDACTTMSYPEMIDEADDLGRTALHYAMGSGAINTPEIVRRLIRQGADRTVYDRNDDSPLTLYIRGEVHRRNNFPLGLEPNPPQGVQKAIDYLDGNPDADEIINHLSTLGGSPLMEAIVYGLNDIVQTLIQFGGNINKRNHDGTTALMKVVELYNQNPIPAYADIITLLFQLGADPNITDIYGQTAIFKTSNTQCIQSLIQNGANPNIRDEDGQTILMKLCKELIIGQDRNIQSINVLIAGGADVNIIDNSNKTAIIYAAFQQVVYVGIGNPALVQLLLQNGADPNLGSLLETASSSPNPQIKELVRLHTQEKRKELRDVLDEAKLPQGLGQMLHEYTYTRPPEIFDPLYNRDQPYYLENRPPPQPPRQQREPNEQYDFFGLRGQSQFPNQRFRARKHKLSFKSSSKKSRKPK